MYSVDFLCFVFEHTFLFIEIYKPIKIQNKFIYTCFNIYSQFCIPLSANNKFSTLSFTNTTKRNSNFFMSLGSSSRYCILNLWSNQSYLYQFFGYLRYFQDVCVSVKNIHSSIIIQKCLVKC